MPESDYGLFVTPTKNRGTSKTIVGLLITTLLICGTTLLLNFFIIYHPLYLYQKKVDQFLENGELTIGEVSTFINEAEPLFKSLRTIICRIYPDDCPP